MRSLSRLDGALGAWGLIAGLVCLRLWTSRRPTPQMQRDPAAQTLRWRTRFSGMVNATSPPTCPHPNARREALQPECAFSANFGSLTVWHAFWARPDRANALGWAPRPQPWAKRYQLLLTTLCPQHLPWRLELSRTWIAKTAAAEPESAPRSVATLPYKAL